jgi:hypothetical protein
MLGGLGSGGVGGGSGGPGRGGSGSGPGTSGPGGAGWGGTRARVWERPGERGALVEPKALGVETFSSVAFLPVHPRRDLGGDAS